MKCRVGLLGLPNVGKSSLFNALAQQSIAEAANYPFCTINPHHAQVAVPDPYLQSLGDWAESTTLRPATIEWIDVAGLAPNAHSGEGLGNQFLATLRECQCLCHVVRAFEDAPGADPDGVVHHVTGQVDPVKDTELIQFELILADLDHVHRRLAKTTCQGIERQVLSKISTELEAGRPARNLGLNRDEQLAINSMGLLTLKPVIYAINVDEVDFTMGRDQAEKRIQDEILPGLPGNNVRYVMVSAKLEADIYQKIKYPKERCEHFSTEYGMEEEDYQSLFCYSALSKEVKELLDLSVVYTGPGVPAERSRTTKVHLFSIFQNAWTANDLAGRLHGDIQRGFIRAQVISAPDLLQFESWAMAKDCGCVRTEGKQYRIAPNDVVLVKWK